VICRTFRHGTISRGWWPTGGLVGFISDVRCLRVDNVDGLDTHVCTGPVDPGASVTISVDWTLREDVMVQHSTQHLVTAIAL